MARVTVEDCLRFVQNRFELVLLSAKRARQLVRSGADPIVPWEQDKATVVALREVATGKLQQRMLDEQQAAHHATSDDESRTNH